MQRNSMDKPSIVNLMLMGSTGSGKSASGNTISGVRDTFKEDFSPEAVTRVCQSAQSEVDGQTITVIDTVGLSDTSVETRRQIEEMLTLHSVDVFLLVIRLGDIFRNESWNAVHWVQFHFGAKVSKHSIVLFTHGDQLHEPIEEYLNKSKTLRSVVDQCSGGFHVFNNKHEDPSQVTELLEKINILREKNEYMTYTDQDYKDTQSDLQLKTSQATAAVKAAAAEAITAIGITIVLGVAAVGAAIGGAIGGAAAIGDAVAEAEAGSGAAATVGEAVIIGAAKGVALAAVTAVCAGVYWLYTK